MAHYLILKSKTDVFFPRTRVFICRCFSDSSFDDKSSSGPRPPKQEQHSSPSESLASYIGDVKAKLNQRGSAVRPPSSQPKAEPLEHLSKYLSEFRRPAPHASLEELYNKNVERMSESGHREALKAIRLSLMKAGKTSEDGVNRPTSFGGQNIASKRIPLVIGGSDATNLAGSINGSAGKQETNADFFRNYNSEELGMKLSGLRPDISDRKKLLKGSGSWFSLEELSCRLKKLREIDDQEAASKLGGLKYQDLRNSLVSLKNADAERKLKKPQRMLSNVQYLLGTTPEFMMYPPKEHLVEKYFHPDNMSASEKLKLQLAKVREEFKMSESDCGSARVQVAQLTTKIKYLSSVLHKKDKHSQKGLQAMVQQRKKLLKYLRRSDWDSYCFVLAKLGLRDNPDYKIRSQ